MSTNLSNLCIHTITTKPWDFEIALENYVANGVKGISIWQNVVERLGSGKVRKLIDQYPIEAVSYVRGGFFPNPDSTKRNQSIEDNKRLIEEAGEIGAPLLVLVCGAHPGQSLQKSRGQIQEGVEHIIPYAQAANVKLGIEPLHPMYAYSRSAINTLKQANDLAELIDHDSVGVVIDVYHLWWEENLKNEIVRCGQRNNIFAYHICDWKSPVEDILNDRGLMGEGCIDLKLIHKWVQKAGFKGFNEVEIFSNHYWSMDQKEFLAKILDSYQKLY